MKKEVDVVQDPLIIANKIQAFRDAALFDDKTFQVELNEQGVQYLFLALAAMESAVAYLKLAHSNSSGKVESKVCVSPIKLGDPVIERNDNPNSVRRNGTVGDI